MSACNRLFRADNVYAYFVPAGQSPPGEVSRVVITADVTINPVADQVRICPNPIAMPAGTREFLIEGTTRTGIHPMLVVKHRISYSYPSEVTPKSVAVYSMGVDAPLRQEVALSASPPPPLEPAVKPQGTAVGASAKPAAGPVELVGYSSTFSFEEALQDALAQATAAFPSPPRNPDVAIVVEVKDISARAHGFIRPGLFLKVNAQ